MTLGSSAEENDQLFRSCKREKTYSRSSARLPSRQLRTLLMPLLLLLCACCCIVTASKATEAADVTCTTALGDGGDVEREGDEEERER